VRLSSEDASSKLRHFAPKFSSKKQLQHWSLLRWKNLPRSFPIKYAVTTVSISRQLYYWEDFPQTTRRLYSPWTKPSHCYRFSASPWQHQWDVNPQTTTATDATDRTRQNSGRYRNFEQLNLRGIVKHTRVPDKLVIELRLNRSYSTECSANQCECRIIYLGLPLQNGVPGVLVKPEQPGKCLVRYPKVCEKTAERCTMERQVEHEAKITLQAVDM